PVPAPLPLHAALPIWPTRGSPAGPTGCASSPSPPRLPPRPPGAGRCPAPGGGRVQLGRVIGTVVATVKAEGLEGVKFLLVQPLEDRKSTRLNSSHEWI